MTVDSVRYDQIRKALKEVAVDGLVCCSASRVLLLTGYWPVMGASIALYSSDGELRVLLPEDEKRVATATSDVRLLPYKAAGLDSLKTPVEMMRDSLLQAVREMKLAGKRVAVEMDAHMQPASYSTSLQFHNSIIDLLKSSDLNLTLTSCGPILQPVESIRTAIELKKLHINCRMAELGFVRAKEHVRPGIRECEIATEAEAAFAAHPGEGIERWRGYFWCMSGPNSAHASGAFAHTTQRVIEDGDLVLVHANTCVDGYWTDVTRTYIAGQPDQRSAKIRSAIDEARAAALQAIRPGVLASDVDKAARDVMRQNGFGDAFLHATGHGVSLAAADPNARPRIHPKSPDILDVNMVFNIEPAAYFEHYGGMRHCDVVRVTPNGAEVETNFQ